MYDAKWVSVFQVGCEAGVCRWKCDAGRVGGLEVGCDMVRCENGVCFRKWDAPWVRVRGGGRREGCVSVKVRCKDGVCFWNWNVRGVCAASGATMR